MRSASAVEQREWPVGVGSTHCRLAACRPLNSSDRFRAMSLKSGLTQPDPKQTSGPPIFDATKRPYAAGCARKSWISMATNVGSGSGRAPNGNGFTVRRVDNRRPSNSRVCSHKCAA